MILGWITGSLEWCGKRVQNTAVVAQDGGVIFEQDKMLLPTYDVFDELRYFEPAKSERVIELAGMRVGISICEDFWFDDELFDTKLYCENPVDQLARQGAEVFLNISASPFNAGKRKARYEIFSRIAQRYRTPLVYVNQAGGNDELLFDGSSIVIDRQGRTIYCAKNFEEDAALVELN